VPARDFFLGLRRSRPVPLILQHERSECGLAVIAMVAGHYGNEVGLHSLRNRASVSSRGASLKDLVEVARDLRLVARPLRLELNEIGNLRLPAILHWRMSHFVSFTIRPPASELSISRSSIETSPALLSNWSLREISAETPGSSESPFSISSGRSNTSADISA
jgi:ATP-binding cassette subfamily B protein RaxB